MKLEKLGSESSKRLQALIVAAKDDLPAEQEHLRELITDQLKVLNNPSATCHWHPAILEWCARPHFERPLLLLLLLLHCYC